jgi:probable F420-dependent oxidoreductase
MSLKLGIMPVLGGAGAADPGATAAFVRLVEELGCESVWAVEHVVIPATYESPYPYGAGGRMPLEPLDDVPDPLEWLTFAAAHSSRLLLGTAMLILPEHNPVILAKRLCTLDQLSGGRLLAGVGVGWLREEYHAVGVPFADRGRRADEYLAALRELWTHEPATFDGRYVSFTEVYSRPRPVRPGGVPLVIGGHSPAAVRRAARYGDGLYPLGVDLAGMATLVELLHAECARIGRDPSTIELTAAAPRRAADVRELAAMGVSRLMMRVFPQDLDRVRADVVRYCTEVLA